MVPAHRTFTHGAHATYLRVCLPPHTQSRLSLNIIVVEVLVVAVVLVADAGTVELVLVA